MRNLSVSYVFGRQSAGIAPNVFGLGAVERQPVRWENCAKPVLYAGTVD